MIDVVSDISNEMRGSMAARTPWTIRQTKKVPALFICEIGIQVSDDAPVLT
jgi:uncharacterized protein (UPF0264 family)